MPKIERNHREQEVAPDAVVNGPQQAIEGREFLGLLESALLEEHDHKAREDKCNQHDQCGSSCWSHPSYGAARVGPSGCRRAWTASFFKTTSRQSPNALRGVPAARATQL